MTAHYPPPASPSRVIGRIAAWTALATVGVLAVAGAALAAPNITTTESPSASASAQPDKSGSKPPHKAKRPGKAKRQGLLPHRGKAVHAEAVVRDKDGKFITVYTQRGAVTAVSSTSITVKSADGFSATYKVTGDTKIGQLGKRKNAAAKIGDIKVGDVAGVVAEKSGNSKNARRIVFGDKDD